MIAIGWIITLLVAALTLTFLAALVSLRKIPLSERPRTRTYDRLGRLLGTMENPDYHEQPGEENVEVPEWPPGPAVGRPSKPGGPR